MAGMEWMGTPSFMRNENWTENASFSVFVRNFYTISGWLGRSMPAGPKSVPRTMGAANCSAVLQSVPISYHFHGCTALLVALVVVSGAILNTHLYLYLYTDTHVHAHEEIWKTIIFRSRRFSPFCRKSERRVGHYEGHLEVPFMSCSSLRQCKRTHKFLSHQGQTPWDKLNTPPCKTFW